MYDFYVDEKNKKVIAVTRYAGRIIRATAKCAPEDNFDIEFGKKLAMLRCEQKCAKIKIRNATTKYLQAAVAADEAQRRYDAMKQYYMDAMDQYDVISEQVEKLI